MKTFTVYILQCSDDTLYVGVTSEIERRLEKHQTAFYPNSYTSSRRPVKLLWTQDFSNPFEAFAREKQIKRWSRAKKMALAFNRELDLKSLSKKKFKK